MSREAFSRTLRYVVTAVLVVLSSLGLLHVWRVVGLVASDGQAEVDRISTLLAGSAVEVARCRLDVIRDYDESASLYDALVQANGKGSETYRAVLARHAAIQRDCDEKSDRQLALTRELGDAKLRRERGTGWPWNRAASVEDSTQAGNSKPSIPTQMATAQEKWHAARVQRYEFTLQKACECIAVGPVRVVVNGDTIEKVSLVGTGQPVNSLIANQIRTIGGLFQEMERALTRPKARVDLVANPQLGYPELIHIAYSSDTVDDEVTYTIHDFLVLSSLSSTTQPPDPPY